MLYSKMSVLPEVITDNQAKSRVQCTCAIAVHNAILVT